MLEIYQKCEKNKENIYGIKKVEELDRPFLLCMSAQDFYDKSVFGMIKIGAEAARVRTTNEMAGGFKINEMPVDFLGLKFKKDENYKNSYQEVVDRFLYPFLTKNGLEVSQIKKQALKANFMTYCNGTLVYNDIEQYLKEKFLQDGLTEEEIISILRCFSLVALGTDFDTSKLYGTTITFVDVNDAETFSEKTEYFNDLLQSQNKKRVYGTLENQNNFLYVYSGVGRHSVKEFLKDESICKPLICSLVAYFLESSIKGQERSSEDVITKLKTYAIENEDIKETLQKLDNEISYQNCPRYSKETDDLQSSIDDICKNLIKKQKEREDLKELLERERLRVSNLIANIKNFSSDITYMQILASSGLWQLNNANSDVLNLPSDREIRELENKSERKI